MEESNLYNEDGLPSAREGEADKRKGPVDLRAREDSNLICSIC